MTQHHIPSQAVGKIKFDSWAYFILPVLLILTRYVLSQTRFILKSRVQHMYTGKGHLLMQFKNHAK